ncbi:succinylglutamate desuccinylase [Winogradskyella wandonensis]|uniref:Succinylglutamate desuccinylase n=1 Tax=Winogradskyella wandonensis TaxID=1442586 RepID=A0A4R1KTJ8_9FLAO|nr:succinylglutamate desuccinylase/aspartoacylase family protein [Winogradskyella wandonensis]TCK67860.1 succinylglutamate desuccinylase [Winogradskyella wandonensis]
MPQQIEKKILLDKRIIHHVKGNEKGPILVFFAGIHGNEQAGIKALKNVLPKLNTNQVKGDIYGIYGNTSAILQNKRYIDNDLNRMWTKEQLYKLFQKTTLTSEEIEQKSILKFILGLLENQNEPIYFIDFHTTSSKTLPFVTINDALINRKFSRLFPVPIVLGIEEYLDGPLLSYLNEKGFVSLGFESGQHTDHQAIVNCESFIHLACYFTNNLEDKTIDFQYAFKQLKEASKENREIYEVVYKYTIKTNEDFKMKSGFKSFEPIKKGTLLATSNNKPVFAPSSNVLFMPLYQETGNDGFFIIKEIPKFFLNLSSVLRQLKADNFLTFLPGISWHDKSKGILRANLKITRFLAKSIFHLFGYRNKQEDETHLLLYNRERVSKRNMYRYLPWYKA